MNVTLHTTFFLTVTFMHLSAACSGPEDGDGSGGEPVTVPTTGSSGGSDGGEGGEGEGVAGMEEAGGVGESGEAGETGATGEYGDEESGGGGEGGDTGDPPIPCGPNGEGRILSIGSNIELCLPKTTCTSETCPPPLGECVEGECVFKGDYKGLATLPEAWATWYCDLSTESCHGVTQINFPEQNAATVAANLGAPLCTEAAVGSERCIGIAASSPMLVGNSQVAKDPVTGDYVEDWGMGMTEASGLCYELTGPGGTVVAIFTDRCGGYCSCNGSGYQECGPCVSAPDMQPNCPCVGTVPGLWESCCGVGCNTLEQACDWCASNNHPHFDLDLAAFNWMCGEEASQGSCQIDKVTFVECMDPDPAWPP